MALGYMRRHRRWLYGFLWLVIAAFIILYIPAFQGAGAGGSGAALARVGRAPITVGEFQRAYLAQLRVYRQLYQGRLDEAQLKSLGLGERVFQDLVAERLIRLEAERLGLSVDDATLAHALVTSPEFNENGRFLGGEELRRRLELQGLSEEEFEHSLRGRLLQQQLQSLVTEAVSVPDVELEREYRRRNERVSAEYVFVDARPLASTVEVSEAEARAHFEAAGERYRIPERRVVSYALIDAESVRRQVSVTDAELQREYDRRREDFRQEEQVCARHVLIKVASGPDAEGHPEPEARRLAEQALARIRGGEDFAEVAKAVSEDRGSATNGGELGCFPRGRMVPEFDREAFSLGVGEVSDLVRTNFGFHVIRVDSRQQESYAPLSQVKDVVRERLVATRAAQRMEATAQALVAALTRGKSLAEATAAQGLTVDKSAPFARGVAPEPIASPLLAAAAFELARGKSAQQAFSVPGGYAFIELAEIEPPRQPDFAEVKDKVIADLREEAALARAREQAAALRQQAVRDGLDKAASARGLVRKETPAPAGRGEALGDLGSGAALDAAVFALATGELSEPVRVEGGWAVVRVTEKTAFDPLAFERDKATLRASLRQQRQGELFQAYLNELRERYPVERDAELYDAVVG
jgi:peptidyl-prolyl cis-trans isomerase D